MKIFCFSLGLALILSACDNFTSSKISQVGNDFESEAKKAVISNLKDPDSAKFGKFTLVDNRGACLTVNARNAFGGYTGDQQATLIKTKGEWDVVAIDALSHETCLTIVKQVLEKNKQSS